MERLLREWVDFWVKADPAEDEDWIPKTTTLTDPQINRTLTSNKDFVTKLRLKEHEKDYLRDIRHQIDCLRTIRRSFVIEVKKPKYSFSDKVNMLFEFVFYLRQLGGDGLQELRAAHE